MLLDSIADPARATFSNLTFIIEAAHSNLTHVQKMTVYLKDITTFNEMNAAYLEFFQDPYPAKAIIEGKGIFRDLNVEIDLIAMKKPDGITNSWISTRSKNY